MPKSKSFDTAINLLCVFAFLFVSIAVIGVVIFAGGSDSSAELEARSSDPQENPSARAPAGDELLFKLPDDLEIDIETKWRDQALSPTQGS